MERTSSPRNTNEGKLLSCWGGLKLKLPWTKGRRTRQGVMGCDITAAFKNKKPKQSGGFRYDPLSYAQNFDDGCWDDDNKDTLHLGFSSRYAAPSSRSLEDK